MSLRKLTVTMTSASAQLVPADGGRNIVIVHSTKGNDMAAVDPTGGTAALDAGISVDGGEKIRIEGKEARSAMTQIGTVGQKLTVYVGA